MPNRFAFDHIWYYWLGCMGYHHTRAKLSGSPSLACTDRRSHSPPPLTSIDDWNKLLCRGSGTAIQNPTVAMSHGRCDANGSIRKALRQSVERARGEWVWVHLAPSAIVREYGLLAKGWWCVDGMANNGGARFGLFACSDFLIGIHREEDEQIERRDSTDGKGDRRSNNNNLA